ncbi:MAG: (Fe-S)-binding protein [Deltaproteobacteria bacterium]|nr:(Fe-S)-binding protein [Deltaproteobacteria bacterium]
MNPLLMTLMLVVALGGVSYTLYNRFALLARMAPEKRLDQPLRRLGLLMKIGMGQSRLIGRKRERSSGAMHAFIFWGALVVGLREVILIGEGYVHGFQEYLPLLHSGSPLAYGFAFAYNVTEAVVLFMLLWALYRRKVLKVSRLELNLEGNLVLYFIIGIMATDLFFDAAKIAWANAGGTPHLLSHPEYGSEALWMPFASWAAELMAPLGADGTWALYVGLYWLHMAVALIFLNILPYTKQFHELTALPNVYLGSLDYPHTPAPLLNLEDEAAWENEALGVARVEQFSWKQGLDLYTCTECGRCYDVCPTFVTGKPLTMKWVNDSLRAHLNEEAAGIRKTGKSGGEKTLVGDVISKDTLWACTTCRACEEVCPVSIEHVPRMLSMRTAQTLMAEDFPKELTATFRGLEQNGNPWNLGYDKRGDWAGELDFSLPMIDVSSAGDIKGEYDVLFWVGCMGSFDKRSQKIARATAALLRAAGLRPAILGTSEKCTGDLARRTGNEMLFQMLAQENVESLNALEPPEIVTICPHCLNALKNEYPQLGGRYQVFHHSQYLARLVRQGRLKLRKDVFLEKGVVFHDPCYLGRYNNEYDAPRSLLSAVTGTPPLEMRRAREEGFCCGAGGGRMWLEENIGSRINEERVAQALETGAGTIATACPFCLTMVGDGLSAKGREEEVSVRDIAEMALDALEK